MSTKREREPEPEDDVRATKQGGATTLGVSMETKRVIMERLFEHVRSSIASKKTFKLVRTHADEIEIVVDEIGMELSWKIRLVKGVCTYLVAKVTVGTVSEFAKAEDDLEYEFTPKGVVTDVCCMLLCKMRAELECVVSERAEVVIILESIVNKEWYAALLAKGVWQYRHEHDKSDGCLKLTWDKAMEHLASKADVTDA